MNKFQYKIYRTCSVSSFNNAGRPTFSEQHARNITLFFSNVKRCVQILQRVILQTKITIKTDLKLNMRFYSNSSQKQTPAVPDAISWESLHQSKPRYFSHE